MGIKLKAWQKGALLFGSFYLFWIGIIHQIFPEGPALDVIGIILYFPVMYTFGIIFTILEMHTDSFIIFLFGILVWGTIGSAIGYLIRMILIRIKGEKK